MILRPGKFLFIHIPRTAGNSIYQMVLSDAIERQNFQDLLFNTCDCPFSIRRHTTLYEVQKAGISVGGQPTIAIMRNPYDIIGSFWCLVQRDYRAGLETKWHGFQPSWQRFCQRHSQVKLSQFIRSHFGYLRRCGGFANWFLSRRHSNTTIHRYEDLNWDRLKSDLWIDSDTPIPHLNRASDAMDVSWDADSRTAVERLCINDFRQFNY